MSDITRKSLGMLIDELSITNIKCFMAQETVMHSNDNNIVAEAARAAQKLNARRSKLIQAIDELMGEENTITDKTYG